MEKRRHCADITIFKTFMNRNSRLPGAPEPMNQWRGHQDLRIAGDAWGQVGKPLVILQHGGGQTRHAWKGMGEQLGEAGFHAIAFDARGHGDSDWAPEGDYRYDVMIEDLKCLIAAFGQPHPILVGASLGGIVSLIAVGEAKVSAAALVLVDVAPDLQAEGVKNVQNFMEQKPEGFKSLEEVAKAISSYQPQRKLSRNLDGLAKNVRLGPDGRYHWHWDPRFQGKFGEENERRERMEACASGLVLPTLLVRGGMSNVLTEEGAQSFLRLCPKAEYVNVAEAGHMVAGDRNDIFAGAVLEFLSRVASISEQRDQ